MDSKGYYLQLLFWIAVGCFIGVNILRETQDGKENKHLAMCADFCADSNFTSIGLWVRICYNRT